VSELSYLEMRKSICKTVKNMWDRRLTNAAGGNLAVRVDKNRILVTPSMMSEHRYCELVPEDILLIDYNENILEGRGKLSRESTMHVKLLSDFQNIGATIHAHPFFCMPYVAFSQPIPNVTEATMGRGYVECIPWSKAYTEDLADSVHAYFDKRRELAERKPIGMIMSKHGVVVSGSTLTSAYSMLERIETDAFCVLAKSVLWPEIPFPANE
jgi:L-fuculose-phosphate aldolase